MILYKDNPNLSKLKVVTTVSGDKEYRDNCRYIKQAYYVKDVDCFEIDGKWYRVVSGKIVLDHFTNKWVLKDSNTLYSGIVGIEDDNVIMGYFSKPNPYYSLMDYKAIDKNGKSQICFDYRVLQENGWLEEVCKGHWYHPDNISSGNKSSLYRIRNNDNFNHLRQGYNIEDNTKEYKTRIQLFNDFEVELGKDVRRFSKFLRGLTFGCEFESTQGYVPTYMLNQLGIVPCRDGSVGGAEYVTIPLTGAKGVQNIKNVCKELTKRTNIDINCSFHIHIGTIPTDRSFMVSLWTLFYKIQDELYTMFPYYKTNPEGIKGKNYCQKLKRLSIHPIKDTSKEGYKNYIDTIYQKIFVFLSEGQLPAEDCNKKLQQHPIRNKWDRKKSRYLGLNLQNMIFSPRHTAEFRIAPPTTNATKAINWLYICAAIIFYAEHNVKSIITTDDNISMKNVLDIYKVHNPGNKYAELLSDYLYAYFEHQRNIFAKDTSKGDYVSSHDISNDKTFSFKFGALKDLF